MIKDIKAAYRYAHSFFLLEKGKGRAEQAHEELFQVLEFIKTHKEFPRLLITSTISYDEKDGLIENLLSFAGADTRNFVKHLVDKGRFNLFEPIVKKFHEVYYEDLGIEEARVVTAFPLEEIQERRLKEILEKKLNKEVRITTQVDPELIGGIIVYTRDEVIDGSLREQLHDMKQDLLG